MFSARRGVLVAAAVGATLVPVAPSLAAEPSSGTVSRAQPGVKWTGSISNALSYTTYWLTPSQGQCLPGSCDTFHLKVADPGGALNITITVTPSTDDPAFEVVLPDGTRVFVNDIGRSKLDTQEFHRANAPVGDYTINYVGNTGFGDTYEAYAKLILPPAPAPAQAPAPPPAPASAPPPPKPAAKRPSRCRAKARKIRNAKRRRAALKRCHR